MKSYSWTAVVPDRRRSNRTLGFVNMKNLAVAAVILAVLGVLSYTYIQSNKKTIHKYLEGNINFSYQTSITSDLNEKERADVYSTDLPWMTRLRQLYRGH